MDTKCHISIDISEQECTNQLTTINMGVDIQLQRLLVEDMFGNVFEGVTAKPKHQLALRFTARLSLRPIQKTQDRKAFGSMLL